ncbi:sugar-binding domain-containing protein [Kocuria sp.]|uniref:sugar-binding domain-containing protein n=1 Tax=Kocuria sp. TaxID=1871328 RepID=UPI0026DCAD9C|nr:sugar-binding domain-containing protein [Kocuria sp.]MDO4919372.1 sugar-binding domain-containing protein [Kocuria sp.]
MPDEDPWPPTDPVRRQHLLAHLAHGHYVDGLSKVSLAEKSGLSRFQVAALLREAQETGVVRIEITVPAEDADDALARAVGLRSLTTVGTVQWPADRDALARATAREITARLREDEVLGISWSRTLQRVVKHLPPLPDNDIVQLAGALNTPHGGEPEAPRLLAGLQCRSAWPLWAPLVVDQAEFLRRAPEIAATLKKACSLDVAVLAVGSWTPEGSTVWSRVDPRTALAAQRAGAVAEVSGHLLDAQGGEVRTPLAGMVVAADLAPLRSTRDKLAVASGADRAAAVLAAVRSGLVDHLVCDAALRDALRALPPAPAGP